MSIYRVTTDGRLYRVEMYIHWRALLGFRPFWRVVQFTSRTHPLCYYEIFDSMSEAMKAKESLERQDKPQEERWIPV